MASCIRNTRTKNYQNPIIAFKVTVENVGGPSFFETQCRITDNRTLTALNITRTDRCRVKLKKTYCNYSFVGMRV